MALWMATTTEWKEVPVHPTEYYDTSLLVPLVVVRVKGGSGEVHRVRVVSCGVMVRQRASWPLHVRLEWLLRVNDNLPTVDGVPLNVGGTPPIVFRDGAYQLWNLPDPNDDAYYAGGVVREFFGQRGGGMVITVPAAFDICLRSGVTANRAMMVRGKMWGGTGSVHMRGFILVDDGVR